MRINDWSSDVCSSDLLRSFAANPVAKPVTIDFDFFAMPVAIKGDGKVQRVIVERTMLDADLRSHGTGETYAVDAGLVISCIGYQTPPIPGVPYEHGRGRFASDDGRILPGLYAVGWARRGRSEEHTSELQSLMRISSAV